MEKSKKVKNIANKSNNHKKQDQPDSDVMSVEQKASLRYSLNEILVSLNWKRLWNPLKTSNPMVDTLGLNGIDKKFDDYKTFGQYMDDMNGLYRSYSAHFPKNINVKRAVSSLLEQCQSDVKSIKTCSDCFEYWTNDHKDYFTNVCAKPHLLVFAKLPNYPLWPAKVMSINGNKALVTFFGDHTQEDIPLTKCFLYSDEFISENSNDDQLDDAIEELNLHIDNIEEKFGSFHAAEGKVVLNGRDMQQQLMSMFPGAFNETTALNSSKEQKTPAEVEDDNDEEPMDHREDDNDDESIESNEMMIDENEMLVNMSSYDLITDASDVEEETKAKETDEAPKGGIVEDADVTDKQREEESVVDKVKSPSTIDPELRATSDGERSVLAETSVELSETIATTTTEKSQANKKRKYSDCNKTGNGYLTSSSDDEDSNEQPNLKIRRVQFSDGVEIALSAYGDQAQDPRALSLSEKLNRIKEVRENLHRTRGNIDTLKKQIKKEKKVRRLLKEIRWNILIDIVAENLQNTIEK